MNDRSPEQLLNSIECLDGIATEALSHIITIANMALLQLERPEGYEEIELIAEAIEVMRMKAVAAREEIGERAEPLGYLRGDDAKLRRLQASARHEGRMN